MAWTNDAIRRRVNEINRTYGDWLIWEQGLPCACRVAGALRMTAGCPRCEGEGFIWVRPEKLKGIVMPVHADRRLLSTMGWLSPADLTFSTDVHSRIQDFDRITLTVPLPADPEVITRGQAHRDGVPGVEADEDRLSYQAVTPIHCATYDHPETALVHGDAYVFSGKTLRWLRPPPDGTVYVLKYEALTEWIAFSSPFETLDRGKHLGQRVLLRKRHLVNLRENPKRDLRTALGM